MTIVEFLEDAGLVFTKKTGEEVVAYCPWHDDRNASLAINLNKGAYHCFNGCIKGRDGMKRLLEKLDPNRNLYQLLIDKFPELYIRKYRSITPEPEDDVKYDVTQLPSAVDNVYLAQRGITNQTILDFDIRYHVGFDSIIVPIYQHGELLGSVQRNISRNPKYVNSKGMDRDKAVFPLDKVEPSDGKIIVVEGLFDAINAHQKGVTNTVCTFGGNVSHSQAKTLGSLARTVIICPDKDSSGLKMADKTTKTLMGLGLRVEYTFPPGKAKDFGDITDFSQLEYHSYWKLKALKKDLNYMMERS